MPLTKAHLEHIATLSRLELPPKSNEIFQNQWDRILGFFGQLAATRVDTSQADRLRLFERGALREDTVTNSLPRDAALRGAPAIQNGMFLVPRVIDK